jgi:hypothetical protein
VGLSQNSVMGFWMIIHFPIMATSPAWNSGDYIQRTNLVSSRQTYKKQWDGQEDNDTIKLRAAFTNRRHYEAGTIQYTPRENTSPVTTITQSQHNT